MGASTSVDVASVVTGIEDKKSEVKSRVKADFHDTKEILLSGKEIIEVTHRDSRLDELNRNQDVDFKLQVLSHQGMENGEMPLWLLKVYENLKLQEDRSKKKTNRLLQHRNNDLICRERKKNVRPLSSYKNNDINNSNSGKIIANQVVRITENSLKSKKFRARFELLKPFKIMFLQGKLDDTVTRMNSLLTEKPEDWREMYVIHVILVKTIIQQIEGILKQPDVIAGNIIGKPSKSQMIENFLSDAKRDVKYLKKNLILWEDLARVIWESRKAAFKSDDIILIERNKGKTFESSKDHDEL